MVYDNTNSGVLFKNENKRKDTDRDYNGNMQIVCPHCGAISEHWISAWINVCKKGVNKGKKFFSFKYSPKDEPSAPPASDNSFDDDIPF